MELTTKQRAYLRSLASNLDTIMQIGKGGVADALIKTVNDALKARELIKMRVLETAGYTPREVAEELAQACEADVVTVIGSKIVLYKKNEEKPKIELPRA
jgi:RNA-binding protein